MRGGRSRNRSGRIPHPTIIVRRSPHSPPARPAGASPRLSRLRGVFLDIVKSECVRP